MTASSTGQPVLLLRLPDTIGRNGKLVNRFMEVSEEEVRDGEFARPLAALVPVDDSRVMYFELKNKTLRAIGRPGAVAEAKCTKPGSYVFGGFLRLWPDEELRRLWSAAQQVTERELEADRALAKLTNDDPLREPLDQLRAVYGKAPGFQKGKLMAMFVEYIARG